MDEGHAVYFELHTFPQPLVPKICVWWNLHLSKTVAFQDSVSVSDRQARNKLVDLVLLMLLCDAVIQGFSKWIPGTL